MNIQVIGLNLFLISILGVAVVYDLRTRRIPNWLVLCGITGGILLNAAAGMDAAVNAILGLTMALGIVLVPFALGWLGAGDAKLLGAVGSILGATVVPEVIFFTAVAGGLLALVSLLCRRGRGFRAFWKDLVNDLKTVLVTQGRVLPDGVGTRAAKGAATLPYGIAIGIGSLFAAWDNVGF